MCVIMMAGYTGMPTYHLQSMYTAIVHLPCNAPHPRDPLQNKPIHKKAYIRQKSQRFLSERQGPGHRFGGQRQEKSLSP